MCNLSFFIINSLKRNLTLLYTVPKRARLAALSTSASSKIRRGDFPPNSSETCFKLLLAAACIISRPTSVEPKNYSYQVITLSTFMCEDIAAPAVGPNPGTTLSTPSGIPALG
ncbi:hypothetical protein Ahy_A05g023118 isoform E [Arachis hypogaea]|uniref:Uncharacterized protein n=1 Tax=Arachis hypogaea TaxID=3818 RepID=A0A445D2G2_ARAHY|nr:hypothetical protein Ahy_A05g023118 isoform E [Arachis hypogaea]